jgi:hypothetical protein
MTATPEPALITPPAQPGVTPAGRAPPSPVTAARIPACSQPQQTGPAAAAGERHHPERSRVPRRPPHRQSTGQVAGPAPRPRLPADGHHHRQLPSGSAASPRLPPPALRPPPARVMAKEHGRTPDHDGQAIRPSTPANSTETGQLTWGGSQIEWQGICRSRPLACHRI